MKTSEKYFNIFITKQSLDDFYINEGSSFLVFLDYITKWNELSEHCIKVIDKQFYMSYNYNQFIN